MKRKIRCAQTTQSETFWPDLKLLEENGFKSDHASSEPMFYNHVGEIAFTFILFDKNSGEIYDQTGTEDDGKLIATDLSVEELIAKLKEYQSS